MSTDWMPSQKKKNSIKNGWNVGVCDKQKNLIGWMINMTFKQQIQTCFWSNFFAIFFAMIVGIEKNSFSFYQNNKSIFCLSNIELQKTAIYQTHNNFWNSKTKMTMKNKNMTNIYIQLATGNNIALCVVCSINIKKISDKNVF